MTTFNFSEIESLKGYSVEWDSKDKLILAKGNNLYEIKKEDSKEINKETIDKTTEEVEEANKED